MKRDCYIVYSISRNKYTKQILEFNFYNCFETETQAKASLQYEADICQNEDEERVTWVNDYTIILPEGFDSNIEILVTYENSVNFYDKNEALFKY